MLKENRKKYMLGIILITAILFVTGVTYAIWSMTLTQESTNVVNTACFKINFIEENEITLQNTYPISDEEGKRLTPYTFTIENICNTNATYQINLEELESDLKKLSKEYIKVSLNDSKGKILNTYETVEKTLNEAETSKKLTTGVLKKGESKTFELRLWMDEDTPAIEDAMNANFESKITIIAVQKEGIPEVNIVAQEKEDGIKVDISTVENPKNETLTYFYQLNEEEEIESEENTYTFQGLSDGKYKVSVRAETLDGIILEEKELEVTIAYESVYISASGNDDTGNGSLESPYATLQPAYNKVKSGGSILLLSDITATSTTNMDIENKEVTLRSNGSETYTILKDQNFTTQILDINNSNIITTTNIIFDGNEVISNGALIEVHNSTLNLNEGTTVQKNNNRGKYVTELNNTGALGGGLFVWQSTLNINGANIINNKTSSQNGVWSNGAGIFVHRSILNLNDGNISYNENIGAIDNQNGGGIVFENGTFTMNGGIVSYNKTKTRGGGMMINNTGIETIMIMNGGIIENNVVSGAEQGKHGGGIHANVDSGSNENTLVYLKGGTIANNTAPIGSDTYTSLAAQIIDERI